MCRTSRLTVPCALACALLVLGFSASARSQDEGWHGGYLPPGLYNSGIAALASYDGRLFAGGWIRSDTSTYRLAEWDGVAWTMHPEVTGAIAAMVVHDGRLVIAGDVSMAGGVPMRRIACWDGSSWSDLGGGFDGHVSALVVHNGELIASGRFLDAGGQPAARIARWDGIAWQPLGSGLDAEGRALTSWNGRLHAGGNFLTAGGVAALRVASWDGAAWTAVGTGMDESVVALSTHAGELVAGGYFTTAGGVIAEGTARWDGSTWRPLGEGTGDAVCAFLSVGGVLYAADDNIHCWNGTTWSRPGGGVAYYFTYVGLGVNALALHDGKLVVGGDFQIAGNLVVNGIASWHGGQWHPMPSGTGFDDTISGTLLDGTTLIVSGRFDGAGTTIANHIARWNGTGWTAYAGGMPDDGDLSQWVDALGMYRGQLVAGGWFTVGAHPALAYDIARWDGARWLPFANGLTHGVDCLLTVGDSLFAGGSFTRSGSLTLNHIAMWSGAAWSPLGQGIGGNVLALAQYGNELIAGGWYNTAGDSLTYNIAAWNGTRWRSLAGGTNGPVHALAIHDGKLFAAGNFPLAGGAAAARVAAWGGTTWSALGAGLDQRVYALTPFHGMLVAGGVFQHAGGLPAAGIARWDGSSWSAFDTGFGLDGGSVYAVAAIGRTLWVGGQFQSVGGEPTTNLGMWIDPALETRVDFPGVPSTGGSAHGCVITPNPFHDDTRLAMTLDRAAHVTVALYDIRGRRVRMLADRSMSAGGHEWRWDGRDDEGSRLPGGMYTARVTAGWTVAQSRVILVR